MDNRSKEKDYNQIIFLSSMLPQYNYDTIRANSIGAISNANNNFQHSMLDGLESNNNKITVINACNIGAYPYRYRKIIYRGSGYYRNKSFIEDISFLNLPKLKHYYRKYAVKRKLKKLLSTTNCASLIIAYDLDYSFLTSLSELRCEGFSFTSVLVIPDLPGFTGSVNHWAYRLFKRKKCGKPEFSGIDGFVLLSKYMADYLNITDKPYTVMEGIYSVTDVDLSVREELIDISKNKYILYTGALDKRNGVIHLLQSFKKVKNSDIKLIICGEGEARQEVENAALVDDRIIYLGQILRDEVLFLQSKAKLLVNPRLASEIFTKYSFPSKTMEYMASGTPVLMYKLASLPKEYEEYIYIIEDESLSSLTNAIETILETDEQILESKGRAAKKFILENKTSKSQMKKIMSFSQKLLIF